MSNVVTHLPDAFRRIHFQLAREPGHPEGDPSETYTLIAPIGPEGRIDAAMFHDQRAACRVVRTHHGQTSAGHLIHGPGGHWFFNFDIAGSAEDERVFRLKDEWLREGEYISVVRPDGEHPFRITAITPV